MRPFTEIAGSGRDIKEEKWARTLVKWEERIVEIQVCK